MKSSNFSQISLLLVSFLFFNTISAQHKLCGHELVLQSMEEKYPGYQDAINTTFENAKKTTGNSFRSNDVYTIPVVVHVVWNEEEENLADSTIQSQIDVLNEDYRRLNSDASNVREIFNEVVGDPMIEFELQEIKRVQTEVTFEVDLLGGLPDAVKVTAEGGSDAVDTETNLNIWICQIQPITIGGIPLGQVLGYAYPPAGLANWPEDVSAPSPELDGVVIDYRVFGRNSDFEIDPGTGTPIVTQGRTTTHEVGHYLGLRHIWGDGGGLFGGDSCDADDGVDDTPNCGEQAPFDCDPERNTCTGTTNDMPDMIENYMDYAAEDCMNSFTLGQIDIMRGILENERCMLVAACNFTSNKTILNDAVRIAPNPTSDIIQISSEEYTLNDFDITIHDIHGKVFKVDLLNQNQINLKDLPTGMYFLNLSNQETSIVKKVMLID